MSLIIEPVKTNKAKIKTTAYMKDGTIPKHPCSVIFNGRSGSGKTVLLHNLLSKKQFYKEYFDMTFLFSGSPDDIFDDLKIPDNRIFKDSKQWESKLEKIFKKQDEIIKKKKGIHKSPRVLIIFEDIQNHQKFLRTSKWFLKSFIANRHFNISTFLTSQSWTKTPRAARINANNIFYFEGSQTELRLLIEEYAPSQLTNEEFKDLVMFATQDDYSFLHINNKLKSDVKFRKNLDKILRII